MLYGYGRVSRSRQETALQDDAFAAAGVKEVVREKWSSVGARPGLHRLIAQLKPGDCLVVWKLDRMGRSLQDLLNLLQEINAAGADFTSLTEHIDTRTPVGRLVFSILGAVAEFERSIIRERSIAGQVAAINRGVKIGRPKSLTDEQEKKVLQMWQQGHTMKALSRHFGVHMTAIRRVVYRVTNPDHPWLQPKRPVIGKYLE